MKQTLKFLSSVLLISLLGLVNCHKYETGGSPANGFLVGTLINGLVQSGISGNCAISVNGAGLWYGKIIESAVTAGKTKNTQSAFYFDKVDYQNATGTTVTDSEWLNMSYNTRYDGFFKTGSVWTVAKRNESLQFIRALLNIQSVFYAPKAAICDALAVGDTTSGTGANLKAAATTAIAAYADNSKTIPAATTIEGTDINTVLNILGAGYKQAVIDGLAVTDAAGGNPVMVATLSSAGFGATCAVVGNGAVAKCYLTAANIKAVATGTTCTAAMASNAAWTATNGANATAATLCITADGLNNFINSTTITKDTFLNTFTTTTAVTSVPTLATEYFTRTAADKGMLIQRYFTTPAALLGITTARNFIPLEETTCSKPALLNGTVDTTSLRTAAIYSVLGGTDLTTGNPAANGTVDFFAPTGNAYLVTALRQVPSTGILACLKVPRASCNTGTFLTSNKAGDIQSALAKASGLGGNKDCRQPDANYFGASIALATNGTSQSSFTGNNILAEAAYPKFDKLVSLGFGSLMPMKSATTAYPVPATALGATGGTDATASVFNSDANGGGNLSATVVDSCDSLGLGIGPFPKARPGIAKGLTSTNEIVYALSSNGSAAALYDSTALNSLSSIQGQIVTDNLTANFTVTSIGATQTTGYTATCYESTCLPSASYSISGTTNAGVAIISGGSAGKFTIRNNTAYLNGPLTVTLADGRTGTISAYNLVAVAPAVAVTDTGVVTGTISTGAFSIVFSNVKLTVSSSTATSSTASVSSPYAGSPYLSAYSAFGGFSYIRPLEADAISCNASYRRNFAIPSTLGGGKLPVITGARVGDGNATSLLSLCVYGGTLNNKKPNQALRGILSAQLDEGLTTYATGLMTADLINAGTLATTTTDKYPALISAKVLANGVGECSAPASAAGAAFAEIK